VLPKDQYNTGDVLKVEVPSQKILKTLKLEKGNMVLLIGGAHPGAVRVIETYQIKRGSEPNLVTFKEGGGTVKENVFVVGDKTPEIKLLEAKVA
jgi:ribosomal protein S4E